MSTQSSRPEARPPGSPPAPPRAPAKPGSARGEARPTLDRMALDGDLAALLEPSKAEFETLSVALASGVPEETARQRLDALGRIKDLLWRRARDGQTLGSILIKHARDPALAGAVATVVGHLSGDVPIVQGAGRAGCAAATLQVALAKERPAEYARVALDLVATGRTTIAGKEFRATEPPSEARGRSVVSVRFQDTFLAAFQAGADGIKASKLKALYKLFGLRPLVSFDRSDTMQALQSGRPVPIVIRNADGLFHAVLAQKQSDGNLTYLDPARGGQPFKLEPGSVAGEVSYLNASMTILRRDPRNLTVADLRVVKEVLAVGVGIKGLGAMSPQARARLEEVASSVNSYLPVDPVGDGSGGVSVAEEFGSWRPPPPRPAGDQVARGRRRSGGTYG